ncbi:IucA/IucC family C-terminal-domain containing protein [Patulibacter defluvii]|uniref:IucA/IucC family C-terminal-domain containing protein n=1 Tax=Patulibacter defluvii TaxID=3095358 RepID=UPI002A761220|nr:IucA/IucC family C-terminal-domain containing protein [Patulibacter sp. DM4]
MSAATQAALARLAALGDGFPIDAARDTDALRAAGWSPSSRLADPAAWPAIADRYARDTMAGGPRAAGGSCALQGYAGRLAGAVLGVWVQTGALLDLAPEAVWVRLVEGRTRAIALPGAAVARAEASTGEVARALLAGHLAPVVAASRTASRIVERVAWGNVAAACAGAFGLLHRTLDPGHRPGLRAAAERFLDDPAWPARELVALRPVAGHPAVLAHERRTCCLMRLSPVKRECAACDRLTAPERAARQAAAAAAATPLGRLPAAAAVVGVATGAPS